MNEIEILEWILSGTKSKIEYIPAIALEDMSIFKITLWDGTTAQGETLRKALEEILRIRLTDNVS